MDLKKVTDSLTKQNPEQQQENTKFVTQVDEQRTFPTQPNLQTQHILSDQQIIDEEENEVRSQNSRQQNQSQTQQNDIVPISIRKRRVIIIIIVIIISILIITGTLLGVFLSRSSSSSSSSSSPQDDIFDDTNAKIKYPKTFKQYKETILSGQDQNIVKMVYVPNTQKIYEYSVQSNSTLISGDGKKDMQITKIVYTIGLLCSSVTEKEFELYLYIINTKKYVNDHLISSHDDTPLFDEKQSRFLEDVQFNEESSKKQRNNEQTRDKLNVDSVYQEYNEFSQLSDEEKQFLSKQGISEQDFYFSSFPIINFRIQKVSIFKSILLKINKIIKQSKDGQISNIKLPINLNKEFNQIYLSVLEQVTPVLKQEFYKIIQNNSKTGQRILLERKEKYKQRNLAQEDIEPNLNAEINSKTNASLKKEYAYDKSKEEYKKEETSYDQTQKIESGALLECQTSSMTNLENNVKSFFQSNKITWMFTLNFFQKSQKNGEEQTSKNPLITKVEIKSHGITSFVKQEDEIRQQFLDYLYSLFSQMTVFDVTYQQALDINKKMFQIDKVKGNPDVPSQSDNNKLRQLQNKQKFIPDNEQKLVKKSILNMDFGATIGHQFEKGVGLHGEDEFTVILKGQYNSNKFDVYEKKTRLNFSKSTKVIQYIQNIVQIALDKVESDIRTNQPLSALESSYELIKIERFLYEDSSVQELFRLLTDYEQFEDFKNTKMIYDFQNKINMLAFKIQNAYSLLFNQIYQNTSSYFLELLNDFNEKVAQYQQKKLYYLNIIKEVVSYEKSLDFETKHHIIGLIQMLDDNKNTKYQSPIYEFLNDAETEMTDQIQYFIDQFMQQSNKIKDQYTFGMDENILDLFSRMQTGQVEILAQNFWHNINTVFKYFRQEVDKSSINNNSDFDIQSILTLVNNLKIDNSNTLPYFRKAIIEFYQLLQKDSDIYFDSTFNFKIQIQFNVIFDLTQNYIKDIQQEIASIQYEFLQEYFRKIEAQVLIILSKLEEINKNFNNRLDYFKKTIKNFQDYNKNSPTDIFSDVKSMFSNTQLKYPQSDSIYDKETTFFVGIRFATEFINTKFKEDYSGSNEIQEKLIKQKDILYRFNTQLKNLVELYTKNFADLSINFKDILPNDSNQNGVQIPIYNERFKDFSTRITSECELLNQSVDYIQKIPSDIISSSIDIYKGQIKSQISDLATNYPKFITTELEKLNFALDKEYPDDNLQFNQQASIKSPIGFNLEFSVQIEFQVSHVLRASLKEGKLQLHAFTNVKMSAEGGLTVNLYTLKVGAHIQATFINAELSLSLYFNFMANDRGRQGVVQVDARYHPYYYDYAVFKDIAKPNKNCQVKDPKNGNRRLFWFQMGNKRDNFGAGFYEGYDPASQDAQTMIKVGKEVEKNAVAQQIKEQLKSIQNCYKTQKFEFDRIYSDGSQPPIDGSNYQDTLDNYMFGPVHN